MKYLKFLRIVKTLFMHVCTQLYLLQILYFHVFLHVLRHC